MIDDQTPAILAHLDLVTEGAGERGRATGRQILSGITLSTPTLYRSRPEDVDAPPRRHVADTGAQLVGFHCSAQLDRLPTGHAYGPLDIEVDLPPSCRVVAFPDAPSAATGQGGSRFTQSFDVGDDRTFAAHALVAVPADMGELRVQLTCRVEVRRRIFRYVHVLPVYTEKGATFAQRIPSGRAVRLVLSIDMKNYSGHDSGGTERAQERLAKVADRARLATEASVEDRQEQGDGIMFVFPPGIDESSVLRAFYAELAAQLREVNLDLSAAAAVRLRVGVDRGLTLRGHSGWTGRGPTTAARLQGCREAREALDAAPGAPFVLTVSDALYRDAFGDHGHVPAAESFAAVEAHVPEKGFAERAWIHLAT